MGTLSSVKVKSTIYILHEDYNSYSKILDGINHTIYANWIAIRMPGGGAIYAPLHGLVAH